MIEIALKKRGKVSNVTSLFFLIQKHLRYECITGGAVFSCPLLRVGSKSWVFFEV